MINPEKLNFKHLIMTIGNLPSSYVESLSYYECLLWLCNYLENTVIPAVNTNGEAVTELQGLYIELKNYVDTYFNNLDVQNEINNKLDEMSKDGTLTNLIKKYVDPFIAEQNTAIENQNQEINLFKNTVNAQIQLIRDDLAEIPSGTPLVASDVSKMTDTSHVYVNTTDGYWYYYNGTNWVQGGVYQASEIPDKSITANKYQDVEIVSMNHYDKNTVKSGYISSNGEVRPNATSSSGLGIYSDYIEIPTGATEVYITPEHNVSWYDSSKVFISGTSAKVAGTETIVDGAKYLRISAYPANVGIIQVNFQHSKAPYDDYKVIISPSASKADLSYLKGQIQPQFINKYKITGYNLFNKNTCIEAMLSSTDGGVVDRSVITGWNDALTSDFIEVKAETTYRKGKINNLRVCYYDENKAFISANANDHSSIVTPENCKYIRVSMHDEDADKLIVIEHSEDIPYGYYPFSYTYEGLTVENYEDNIPTDFNYPIKKDIIDYDTFINRHTIDDYVTVEDDAYVSTKDIILNKELNHADTTRNNYYIKTSKRVVELYFDYKSIGVNNNIVRFEYYDKTGTSIGNYYPKLNFKLNNTNWTPRKLRVLTPINTAYVRIGFGSYEGSGLYLRYINCNLLNDATVSVKNNLRFIAHLGMPLYAPRNTIPSFEYAINAKMDSCVMNINWTSDSEIVVLHDDTINATSDGTGNIHNMTYEQALQYDFGSYFDPAFTGTKIPKLEEVLDLFAQAGISPTIRWHDSMSDTLRDKVFDMFEKHGLKNNVTIIGFTLSKLEELHSLYPNYRYGHCCYSVTDDVINRVKALGKGAFIDISPVPSKSIVDQVHAAGLDIECWFVNTINDLETAFANGVDGIKTDIYALQNCNFK